MAEERGECVMQAKHQTHSNMPTEHRRSMFCYSLNAYFVWRTEGAGRDDSDGQVERRVKLK